MFFTRKCLYGSRSVSNALYKSTDYGVALPRLRSKKKEKEKKVYYVLALKSYASKQQ